MDDDAADLAELAELRRRVYGPAADLSGDPRALARLEELTGAARSAGAREPEAAALPRADAPARGPAADPPAPRPHAPPAPRRGWRSAPLLVAAAAALVVAVAVTAATAGIPDATTQTDAAPARPTQSPRPAPDPFGAASPFAGDTKGRVLIQVPIDGSFGDYFDRPAAGEAPPFPVPEEVRWSAPLGEYYGWQLWLARSRNGLPCVAVVDDGDVRADCRPLADFDRGALVVTVPYEAIRPDERPDGLRPGESVGFAWLSDAGVTIVAGRTLAGG